MYVKLVYAIPSSLYLFFNSGIVLLSRIPYTWSKFVIFSCPSLICLKTSPQQISLASDSTIFNKFSSETYNMGSTENFSLIFLTKFVWSSVHGLGHLCSLWFTIFLSWARFFYKFISSENLSAKATTCCCKVICPFSITWQRNLIFSWIFPSFSCWELVRYY